jgi:hypothetical protein
MDAQHMVPAGKAVIEYVWGRYADGTMTEPMNFAIDVTSPASAEEVWAKLESVVRRAHEAQGIETRHYFLEQLVQEGDATYFVYGT